MKSELPLYPVMAVLSGHGPATVGHARSCKLTASGGRKAVEAGTVSK